MSITVKTQAELDAAIAAGSQGIIIDSPAGVWLSVGGSATVRAWGSSTVRASGSATVRASGSATVRAWGSATVEASGSSTVRASDSATVRAWGSATVEASGSSTVRAWDSATVEAWDSSTVRAWDSVTVRAWGSATVRAWDSSTVEAWGSSTVRAWGSATVRASGSATVRASGSATVEASPLVAVYLHSGRAVIHGGTLTDLTAITETDPVTWCAVHGVAVTDGVASLYKATDGDLTAGHSYRMVRYDVGTEPTAPDFDARNECGGGLHLSPTTGQATIYRSDASWWVRVEVPVGEIVPIPSLLSGAVAKCKVRTCRVVAEVDRDGREIAR